MRGKSVSPTIKSLIDSGKETIEDVEKYAKVHLPFDRRRIPWRVCILPFSRFTILPFDRDTDSSNLRIDQMDGEVEENSGREMGFGAVQSMLRDRFLSQTPERSQTQGRQGLTIERIVPLVVDLSNKFGASKDIFDQLKYFGYDPELSPEGRKGEFGLVNPSNLLSGLLNYFNGSPRIMTNQNVDFDTQLHSIGHEWGHYLSYIQDLLFRGDNVGGMPRVPRMNHDGGRGDVLNEAFADWSCRISQYDPYGFYFVSNISDVSGRYLPYIDLVADIANIADVSAYEILSSREMNKTLLRKIQKAFRSDQPVPFKIWNDLTKYSLAPTMMHFMASQPGFEEIIGLVNKHTILSRGISSKASCDAITDTFNTAGFKVHRKTCCDVV